MTTSAEPQNSRKISGTNSGSGWGRRLLAWITAALIAALVVFICGASLIALYVRAAEVSGPEPTPPLPVEVVEAQIEHRYTVIERFAGRIEAAQETELAFERGGLVTEIGVEEGDRVKAGQVIARLDARGLQAERDRLAAEKLRVATELALAERTRKRQQDLSNKGFASEQRFDEAQANETALKAQIQSIEAQVRQRDIDIEKSSLTAPFDGLIAERFLDPGAVTNAGRAVARLLEIKAPRARIGVPPEQASALRVGESYPLSIRSAEVQARLIALRPDLAPGTRTVAALFDLSGAVALGASVDRSAGVAREIAAPSGEIVRLALTREIEANGLWLPLSAMQEGVKGMWSVYTVVKDDAASQELGESVWRVGQEAAQVLRVRGDEAFVSGSIRQGALVVVKGVNRIARGQRVRPLDPAPIKPDEVGLRRQPARFAQNAVRLR